MTRGLERLIYKIHKEKGNINECSVEKALQFLLDQKKIDYIEHNIELDNDGIDYLVGIKSKRYMLSVKSSVGGIQHELENRPQRHRHKDKLFIIPGRDETCVDLGGRIIGMINDFEEQMHAK